MPTYDVQVSTTAYPLVFMLVQSVDHITALNSATPTVTISKAGASFASPAGSVTEIGTGWYKVGGNATDTNALGPLILHATAGTSSDPSDAVYNVVAYNPQVANLAANLNQWLGVSPAALINALVQTMQSGNIAGNVSGSVGSVTGSVASVTSGVNTTQIAGAVVNTATAQIGTNVVSHASGQSPAVQVWDTAAPIELGISPRQALVYIAAAEAGFTTSSSPTNFAIAAISNSGTTRITAVTDASGNRTSVSLT